MTDVIKVWRWSGAVLFVISCIALIGSLLPTGIRFAPNMGVRSMGEIVLIGFAFSGAAIAAGPSRLMRMMGVPIIVLAGAAVFHIIVGWSAGDEPWHTFGDALGRDRVPFIIALAFLCVGISCQFVARLDSRGSIPAALALLTTVFSLSLIGIAAYLMNLPLWELESIGDTTGTLPTSVGLIWVTFGLSSFVAVNTGWRQLFEEHPDRRILVRAVVVAAMLILAAGILAGAIVARNSVVALGRTLAEIRDTNALLLNVAIREAERQGRLVANTAQDADDNWVLGHLAQMGTDSVLAIWQDMPGGTRRMLTGRYAGEPEVDIPLDAVGTSHLMWNGRWIVEVHDGAFVSQIVVSGLEQLFKNSPELGNSSDVVICARHGSGIVFFPTRLNPAPFVRDSFLNADGEPFPASRALDGHTETLIARDYRGRQVFAAVAPIALGKLGIVQKIDTAEALAPLRGEFWKALILTLVLLGLGALLLRRFVHPLVIDLRAARNEISRSHAQLQLLAAHMEEVREEEQKRISREIHDEMGGTLAAIDMQVHQMSDGLPPEMPELAGQLGLLKTLGTSALGSMRKVVSQLRPTALDDLGLPTAIDQCAAEFEVTSGVVCRRKLIADTSMLTDSQSTMIFRILQESLNNIAKHARASEAEVSLEIVGSSLVLTVRDDGRGFDMGKVHGECFGLMGMRERARIIGAKVEIVSAQGQGTKVTLTLPLSARLASA